MREQVARDDDAGVPTESPHKHVPLRFLLFFRLNFFRLKISSSSFIPSLPPSCLIRRRQCFRSRNNLLMLSFNSRVCSSSNVSFCISSTRRRMSLFTSPFHLTASSTSSHNVVKYGRHFPYAVSFLSSWDCFDRKYRCSIDCAFSSFLAILEFRYRLFVCVRATGIKHALVLFSLEPNVCEIWDCWFGRLRRLGDWLYYLDVCSVVR